MRLLTGVPYDGFAMEHPPNAVPNEGVNAIAIFPCVLTETAKAEPITDKTKISSQ